MATTLKIMAVAAAAAAASWTPAAAQRSAVPAVDKLQPGLWQVRYRDATPTRRICLRTGRELIQLRHSLPGCSRSLVSSTANEAIFQYTCRGAGYGRTVIRRETSVLAQLSGQGIAKGYPYEFSAEARRVGSCS